MLACAMLLAYLLSVYRYLMLLNQNKATLKRKKIPKMLRLFRDNWCFLVMICLSSLILDAELCPHNGFPEVKSVNQYFLVATKAAQNLMHHCSLP